jgi:hypothetical protein
VDEKRQLILFNEE